MTKKVTKYGIMIIAAVLLVAMVFAGAVSAATEITWDCGKINPSDVKATLNLDTGVMTVSGVGDMASMETSTQPWKDYRSQIKKVIISEGVTSVGASAFQKCSELLEIEVPSTVTYIWDWAFGECTKLTTVDLMSVANPEKLCYGAFRQDPNLRSIKVNFADRVGDAASTGSYVFYQDYLLESTYMVGGKIWFHGNPIWHSCNNLVQVVIDVESIDGWYESSQFGSIGADSVIYIPNGATLPNAIYSKPSTAVANIVNKANGQYKFVGTDAYVELNNKNSPLETVPLGKAVVWRDGAGTVVTSAPAVDTVLTVSLEDLPGGTCGDGVNWCFNEQTGELNIWGNSQITSTPWTASYAGAIKTVEISAGITDICDNAFKDCTSLKRVSIGKDIANIGSNAFSNIGENSIIYAHSDTAASQLVAGTNYADDKTAVAKVIDELLGTYEFRGTANTLYLNRDNTPFSVNERVGMTWKDGGSEVSKVPETTKTLTLVFGTGSWGTIGNGIRWVYDKYTKTLTFDGNGEISASFTPYKDQATSIVIENGNIKISNDAFAQMTKVTSVSIENAKVTVSGQKKNLGVWNVNSASLVIFTDTFDLTSLGSSLDLTAVFLGDGVFEISDGAALKFADGWKSSATDIKNAMDAVFEKIGIDTTILVGTTLYTVDEPKTAAGDSWVLTDTTASYYSVTIKATNGTVNKTKIEDVIDGSPVTVNGQTLTVKSNDVLATPTAKTGYATIFSRWSVEGSEYTGGTVTGNMEITAEFIRVANKYNVSFDGNGADAGSQSDVIATYDVAMPEVSSIGFMKQGYNFIGYFDKKSAGTKYYNADGTSAKIWDKLADTQLYAQWMVNTTDVIASVNKAEFGNDNITAVRQQTSVLQVLLENVSSVNNTAVNFTADNTTVQIPTIDGYTKEEIAVFDLNASVNGTTSLINVTVTFADAETVAAKKGNVRFVHYIAPNWEQLTSTIVGEDNANVTYMVETTSFSPFGIGIYTIIPSPAPQYTSSSSSHQGGSVLLQEGQVAPTQVPTSSPTVKPTVSPTEKPATPTVKPTAQPTQTQKSPAPFVGLLAGLGAAAVLLRLRK